MITIDPELEMTLTHMAMQEHVSPNEIIKRLINNYMTQRQASELLTDIANDLPDSSGFAHQDAPPLQKELHETTMPPITQSLVGLLANASINESDYKKHLEERYL